MRSIRSFQKIAGFGAAALALSMLSQPAHAATLTGPTSYSGFGSSPFAGETFSWFYLEDFQDGLLNAPGLSANGGVFVGAPGSLSDSVEFTPNGGSAFNASGATGLTFVFDSAVLGALPTHAGLVWTDGRGTITFEAFDASGISLGTLTGNHADAAQTGETGEDRFYGVTNQAGISRIRITNTSGGIEADHVQYGFRLATVPGAVPEPATWAMMILGFGAVGGILRRRTQAKLAFA